MMRMSRPVTGLVAMISVTAFALLSVGATSSAASHPRGADDVERPKLKISSTTLTPGNVTRGASAKLTVSVKNKGDLAAAGTRICIKLPGKVAKAIFPDPACRALGTLRQDVTRTREFMIRTGLKAVPKAYLTVVVTSTTAGTARKQVLLRTKR